MTDVVVQQASKTWKRVVAEVSKAIATAITTIVLLALTDCTGLGDVMETAGQFIGKDPRIQEKPNTDPQVVMLRSDVSAITEMVQSLEYPMSLIAKASIAEMLQSELVNRDTEHQKATDLMNGEIEAANERADEAEGRLGKLTEGLRSVFAGFGFAADIIENKIQEIINGETATPNDSR